MRFMVVDLVTENMPDGSFHVYSPNVPGFHVVEKDEKKAVYAKAHRILYDTVCRRAQEAGHEGDVKMHDAASIRNLTPSDLRNELHRKAAGKLPDRLVIEFQ
jgi:hypothetical protein